MDQQTKSIVCFGAGRNSTAMILGLYLRDIRPNWILFGDTGTPGRPSELPGTLEHLARMNDWTLAHWGLPITVVRGPKTLEQDCLDRCALPALAYGWRTCSERFKQRPQHKFLSAQPGVKAYWKAGGIITRYIGIHNGEAHRMKESPDHRYQNAFPLLDWAWDQPLCETALKQYHIDIPPKSACFFCPARKLSEIQDLAKRHPDYYARALHIEALAIQSGQLRGTKGLGRRFAWGEIAKLTETQCREVTARLPELPCDCYDG